MPTSPTRCRSPAAFNGALQHYREQWRGRAPRRQRHHGNASPPGSGFRPESGETAQNELTLIAVFRGNAAAKDRQFRLRLKEADPLRPALFSLGHPQAVLGRHSQIDWRTERSRKGPPRKLDRRGGDSRDPGHRRSDLAAIIVRRWRVTVPVQAMHNRAPPSGFQALRGTCTDYDALVVTREC